MSVIFMVPNNINGAVLSFALADIIPPTVTFPLNAGEARQIQVIVPDGDQCNSAELVKRKIKVHQHS